MDRDGLITLTPSGMEIASKMLDRHRTLTQFLIAIGVDQKTAEQDACKIEHDISQQTYDAMCPRPARGRSGRRRLRPRDRKMIRPIKKGTKFSLCPLRLSKNYKMQFCNRAAG